MFCKSCDRFNFKLLLKITSTKIINLRSKPLKDNQRAPLLLAAADFATPRHQSPEVTIYSC